MHKHIHAVGFLHAGLSGLMLLVAALIFSLLIGVGWAIGNRLVMSILAIVGALVSGTLVVIGLPGLIGGVGLLQMRPWARILLLVLSVVELLIPPILGTLIGAYSIWVLLQDETATLLTPKTSA
jgi:hypothetical protein